MKAWLPICTVSALAFGCVSRAPSDCELDKRAGVYPSSFCDIENAKTVPSEAVRGEPVRPKAAALPVRDEPVVAKVWVHDQILDGGNWLQGTWLFIEVEPSQWARSVERGAEIVLPVSVRAPRPGTSMGSTAAPAAVPPSPVAKAGRGGEK